MMLILWSSCNSRRLPDPISLKEGLLTVLPKVVLRYIFVIGNRPGGPYGSEWPARPGLSVDRQVTQSVGPETNPSP